MLGAAETQPGIGPEILLRSASLGGEYLIRHQDGNGKFHYEYDPERDESSKSYNLLRHAGTCYALLELYEATSDERFLKSARTGLAWLLEQTRGPKPEDKNENFLCIVSKKDQAKLGGTALALLALAKYESVTGDRTWRPVHKQFFEFIRFMQHPDGEFESKYFYGEPDRKKFVSKYYPGEAVLALCRAYRLDPVPEYLEVARRGADWLIEVRDGGKSVEELRHDHWLSMALNELDDLTEEDRYRAQARKIAEAILLKQRREDSPNPEWIGTFYSPPRSTPCSTRGEALSAVIDLGSRHRWPVDEYIRSLELIAGFVRRCQIDEKRARIFPRPEEALGGITKSLEDLEIRIDYVQHGVSMMLGLRRALLRHPE